jgi:hypothetical protein
MISMDDIRIGDTTRVNASTDTDTAEQGNNDSKNQEDESDDDEDDEDESDATNIPLFEHFIVVGTPPEVRL